VAALTVQQLVKAGITPAYVTPTVTVGDTIAAPDDRTYVQVKNASGSPITVSVSDPGTTPSGNLATIATVSVPATTGDKLIPVPASAADPATGLATVICSAITSVTIGAFRR
jgi:hypothetical protein